jgi:3-oxoacyl-[acyl-carrier-protein] synthase-3
LTNKPVAQIVGTGFVVPDKIITNDDLGRMVDTSDEWITTRTGISTRHIISDGVTTSDLSSEAAMKALDDAGVKAEDVDIIILGTISGDVGFPATACYVQEKIGAVNAAAFDLSAACSGFVYGLTVCNGLFSANNTKNALVIGAETLSRITNWQDRNTCVLFGDGAGAAVLQPSKNGKGIISSYLKSDGRLSSLLMNPGHNTQKDFFDAEGNKMLPYINMQGRETFKYAVRCMEEAIYKSIEQAQVSLDDITLLIPHQANVRIIDMIIDRTGIKKDRVYVNVDRYGNTSAASVPIALDEARKEGRLPDGSLCLMTVFGGGFTWGSVLIRF